MKIDIQRKKSEESESYFRQYVVEDDQTILNSLIEVKQNLIIP